MRVRRVGVEGEGRDRWRATRQIREIRRCRAFDPTQLPTRQPPRRHKWALRQGSPLIWGSEAFLASDRDKWSAAQALIGPQQP